jgi:UDP-3-O-[3-hydroxymyristoyl] glucosamine N-acyltransferase
MGSPAIPADEYKRIYMHTRRLDRLMDRIQQLEKQIAEIQSRNSKV